MPQSVNPSERNQIIENSTKIQLAKRQLNSIQQKFKKFKSKSREHTERQSTDSRMCYENKTIKYMTSREEQSSFVPDLRQYFSFMMEKENQPILSNQLNSDEVTGQKSLGKVPQKYEENQRLYDENLEKISKRSIQQKLIEQKSQAINSLQSFFANKKSQLEAKINTLQNQKHKATQDINLLKRNNSELQTQIKIQKNMIFTDATEILREKREEILNKIARKKENISKIRNDCEKIKCRKDELKRNISECLRGNKYFVAQDKKFGGV